MKFKPLVAFASGVVMAVSFATPKAFASSDIEKILLGTLGVMGVVDALHESDSEKQEKAEAIKNQESLIAGKWQSSNLKKENTYLWIGSNNRCSKVYIKGSISDYYRDTYDCNYDKIFDNGYFSIQENDKPTLLKVKWINENQFRTEILSHNDPELEGRTATWNRLDREVTASYGERRITTRTRRTRRSSSSSSSSSSRRSYSSPSRSYTPRKTVDYTDYNKTRVLMQYRLPSY